MTDPKRFSVWRLLRERSRRTLVIIGLMVLAGAAEGVGVLTLLPVLEVAGSGSSLRHSGESRNPWRGVIPRSVEGSGPEISSVGPDLTTPPPALSNTVSRAAVAGLGWLGASASLGALFAVIVLALLVKAGLRWVAMAQVGTAVAEVSAELRLRLLRATFAADWNHVAAQPAGRAAGALSRDAFWGGSAYRAACATLAALTQLAIYFALLLLVSWQLGLLALAAGVAVSIPIGWFVRVSRRQGRSQTQLAGELVTHFVDVLQAIKPIRAMGREDAFLSRLSVETQALRVEEERHVRTAEGLRALLEPVLGISVIAVLFVLLRAGGGDLPTIAVVGVLLQRIAGRFQVLQAEYHEAVTAGAAYEAVEAQIAEALCHPDASTGTHPAPPIALQIELDSVRFRHGGEVVLDEVSLSIRAGSFVAIMGASGAGKSTLLDLIAGLRQPESGRLWIDGVPLDRIDPVSWRRQLGYVPQEGVLLNASVLDNVLLGGPMGLGRADAEQALLDSGAGDFLAGLPRGLDSEVGERGVRLSGGERRRIALARALVRAPRLLILDEATAELDAHSASEIGRILHSLRGRLTIITATHQQELAAFADEVYVLGDGRLMRSRTGSAPGLSRVGAGAL